MAKCKCGKNWFWDWEQDTYRYIDGSEIEILTFANAKSDEPKIEIYIFKCKCGAINSIMYTDPNTGMFVRCIEEWNKIKWEDDGHSWDQKCLNCESISCLNDKKDYCQDVNSSYNNVEG